MPIQWQTRRKFGINGDVGYRFQRGQDEMIYGVVVGREDEQTRRTNGRVAWRGTHQPHRPAHRSLQFRHADRDDKTHDIPFLCGQQPEAKFRPEIYPHVCRCAGYVLNRARIGKIYFGDKQMRTLVLAALVLMGLGATASVQAQEKKLERKDLPAAVRTAVDRESAGATVKGFSTERENGIRTYEAELMVDGHSKDVSMDAAGNVLEIETSDVGVRCRLRFKHP